MWEIEKNFKVKIGGNYFVNCESLISYDDEPLFTLKRRDSDGRLGIDFDVYDSKGNKIATIRRGNVVQGDIDAYEISHLSDCHKVIEKASGRVIVQIDKNPPDAELAVSVNMYLPNGYLFEATPDNINIKSNILTNNLFSNPIGITIGESSKSAGVKLEKPEVK